MTMYYSHTTGGFYPDHFREAYEKAGSWPDDAIALTDAEYTTLRTGLDEGKRIIMGANSRPALVNMQPPTLIEVKEAKRAQIVQWQTEAEHAGMPYTFPGGNLDTIQLRNDRDRANINGQVTTALVLKAQGVTDPILPFRAESNTTYLLTPDEMQGLGVAVGQFGSAMYQIAWGLKEQVELATTIEAVEAIVWPTSLT